jgi:hypothetical protein
MPNDIFSDEYHAVFSASNEPAMPGERLFSVIKIRTPIPASCPLKNQGTWRLKWSSTGTGFRSSLPSGELEPTLLASAAFHHCPDAPGAPKLQE